MGATAAGSARDHSAHGCDAALSGMGCGRASEACHGGWMGPARFAGGDPGRGVARMGGPGLACSTGPSGRAGANMGQSDGRSGAAGHRPDMGFARARIAAGVCAGSIVGRSLSAGSGMGRLLRTG
jgi:hypothetical protein